MANCQSSQAFAPPIFDLLDFCEEVPECGNTTSASAAEDDLRFDLIQTLGLLQILACAFSTARKVLPVAVKVFAFFFAFFAVFAMASSRDPTEFAF